MPRIATVADLIRELEDACAGAEPAEVPIRIAGFGSYNAFAYHVSGVVSSEDDQGTVYIGEGGQIGYLDSGVRAQF
jgi:hypothetical protein